MRSNDPSTFITCDTWPFVKLKEVAPPAPDPVTLTYRGHGSVHGGISRPSHSRAFSLRQYSAHWATCSAIWGVGASITKLGVRFEAPIEATMATRTSASCRRVGMPAGLLKVQAKNSAKGDSFPEDVSAGSVQQKVSRVGPGAPDSAAREGQRAVCMEVRAREK